jgi:hypothetical protein
VPAGSRGPEMPVCTDFALAASRPPGLLQGALCLAPQVDERSRQGRPRGASSGRPAAPRRSAASLSVAAALLAVSTRWP